MGRPIFITYFFFFQRITKESCGKESLPPENISRGRYHKAVELSFSQSTNIEFSEAGSVGTEEKLSRAAFPGGPEDALSVSSIAGSSAGPIWCKQPGACTSSCPFFLCPAPPSLPQAYHGLPESLS